jgi:hypothetical protein
MNGNLFYLQNKVDELTDKMGKAEKEHEEQIIILQEENVNLKKNLQVSPHVKGCIFSFIHRRCVCAVQTERL